jgi:hypothetical protein
LAKVTDKPEVRLNNGRFGPGNKTGGRKPRAVEEEYKRLFKRVVKVADRKAIIAKAMEQAKRGDDRARKFIFDYLYGPPPQRQEFTGADGGEIVLKWMDTRGDQPPPAA